MLFLYGANTFVSFFSFNEVLAVVDSDDEEAIVCSAELTRDMDDKPIGLAEFDKTIVKKASIVFGGLFEPVTLAQAKIEDFESLWEEMKPKILHRSMGI